MQDERSSLVQEFIQSCSPHPHLMCPPCADGHGSVVDCIYGDRKRTPATRRKDPAQNKTNGAVWDIHSHTFPVTSNYAVIVCVKFNGKQNGGLWKVTVDERTTWEEREGWESRWRERKAKLSFSKSTWSIKDPWCKKQHLSFCLWWALEGIMSHDIFIVQNAREYFDTSL